MLLTFVTKTALVNWEPWILKKVFDSLDHDFLIYVLEKFRFGDNLIKWGQVLLTNHVF